MMYESGHNIDCEVIKAFGENEDFFRLQLPDGTEGRLPKLKFQRDEPLPDHIRCRIKYVNAGVPILGHLMPQYVNRLYYKDYSLGKDFEFTVLSIPSQSDGKFIIEDKYGIRFNLFDSDAMLVEGQKVRCRFTRLSSNSYNLERSNSDVRVIFQSPSELLSHIGVAPVLVAFFEDCIYTREDLVEIKNELEHANPLWPLTALKSVYGALSDWFVESEISQHLGFFNEVLHTLREAGLYIIENSRFMRNLPDEQRRTIQSQVTEIVEGLEPFRRVLQIVAEGSECEFVENLMDKLRQSGYLYHPARQFSTLMLILRISPDLVRKYLGGIFATLMEWKLETWTTEPFKSAFVDQFEIFIRRTCGSIDRLPQAETEAEVDNIEKIVTAIALQMLISGENSGERWNRNRSLFYRYISLLRPNKCDGLLDKSFLALMGVNMPIEFTYDTIREPIMLMTRATIALPNGLPKLGSTHTCRIGGVQISVDDSGIVMRRADEKTDSRALPVGMMEWLSPTVYLDKIPSIAGSKINSLDAHRRLWGDIEKSLFEKRAIKEEQSRVVRKADIDDQVWIIIDPVEIISGENPRWACRIDDPYFESDSGYVDRPDLVSFALRSGDLDRDRRRVHQIFMNEDGVMRHFQAVVKGIDADGRYKFSLLTVANEQVSDVLTYSDTYLGVITRKFGNEYSVISETGYSMFLREELGEADYQLGDVVIFRMLDTSSPEHMLGTIIGLADDGVRVDKLSALDALLATIEVELDEDENDESVVLDDDETLTCDEVTQIIELFRIKAISSEKMLNAFDYLRFARLLALAIGDESLADSLATHAALLRLHQFYAMNSRVDADELELYRNKVVGAPLLEIIFHRLEIVSWLGDVEHNAELWATVSAPRNNLESTLSRLVLSYNMLPDVEDADSVIAKGLKSKIAQLLGVNFEPRALKSYGSENQFKEFKSSIVYPARPSKSTKVEADPERQQHVILKIIASFLNASGGTLYIGVNDSTRCEAGLFEDLEYYKYRRAMIGTISYEIHNVDNLCNYLANLVRHEWGVNVAGHVEIEPDSEAKHDVIVVKVRERLSPVLLDGKIYVRRSGSSVMLHDNEYSEFIEDRKEMELRRKEELAHVADKKPEPNVVDEIEQPPVVESPQTIKIPTSAWRSNILHNYEDGYSDVAAYLYFADDFTLRLSHADIYGDLEPWCQLALAVNADEARTGYLVLLYENRRVLKVPMTEVLEKNENVPIPMYHDCLLTFATIAMPNDALLLHLSDSKKNMYRRVVPLSEIVQLHLTSSPERFVELPGVNTIEACEMVDSTSIDSFRDSLTDQMSSRQIGNALRCGSNTDKARLILKEDIKNAQRH